MSHPPLRGTWGFFGSVIWLSIISEYGKNNVPESIQRSPKATIKVFQILHFKQCIDNGRSIQLKLYSFYIISSNALFLWRICTPACWRASLYMGIIPQENIRDDCWGTPGLARDIPRLELIWKGSAACSTLLSWIRHLSTTDSSMPNFKSSTHPQERCRGLA